MKQVMIGLMLLVICSCKIPTVKKPVDTCIINYNEDFALCGLRNFNIKSKDKKTVGEWIDKTLLVKRNLSEVHNYMCIAPKGWLVKIKPKLKEGNQAYKDSKD